MANRAPRRRGRVSGEDDGTEPSSSGVKLALVEFATKCMMAGALLGLLWGVVTGIKNPNSVPSELWMIITGVAGYLGGFATGSNSKK